ncbi:MAG: anthranilate synthase component I family protein [Candidatus Geothermarchaeales archaeon]
MLDLSQRVLEIKGRFEVYSLYTHLRERFDPPYSFLLESIDVSGEGRLYSYICLEPDFLLQIDKERLSFPEILSEGGDRIVDHIRTQGEEKKQRDAAFDDRVEYDIGALEVLSKAFPYNNTRRPEIFSRQVFYGGFIGYLGWDILAPWAGFKRRAETPDILLGFNTKVLIYDHGSNKLYLVDNSLNGEGSNVDNYRSALENYSSVKPLDFDKLRMSGEDGISNMSREEFMRMVTNTKEYIYSGDIFQAVVSRRIDIPNVEVGDLEIYRVLRELNPSPYMYYLDFGDPRFIGCSPEALLTINGRKMVTVPIAGTRKRGETPEEDREMERELMNDPKERAEHVMLVDLARNDLAKVSNPGTVKPSIFMVPRRYKNVMHIVTVVEGIRRKKLNSFDVLKSVFPAGTVSGAPKLRAIEIIEEQEKDPRGPYAGVIGYVSLNQDCDWAITIRTIQLMHDRAMVQVGSGIVADSRPELEWKETKNKARSLLMAVGMARQLGA